MSHHITSLSLSYDIVSYDIVPYNTPIEASFVSSTGGSCHLEVRPESGDVLDEPEEHVGVEGPLVSFVDHHHAVASQVRLGEELAEKHAVGHVLLYSVFMGGGRTKNLQLFDST